MALEADCGSSTVLAERCLARTVGFPLPGEFWVALRNGATPAVGFR